MLTSPLLVYGSMEDHALLVLIAPLDTLLSSKSCFWRASSWAKGGQRGTKISATQQPGAAGNENTEPSRPCILERPLLSQTPIVRGNAYTLHDPAGGQGNATPVSGNARLP